MERTTFTTAGPLRIVVEIEAGDIRVQTDDTETTSVQVEASRGAQPEVHQAEEPGGGSTIWVRSATKKRFRSDTDVAISCPHGAELDVTTGSAGVVVRGSVGALGYRAGSGDLVFERVDRDVSVKVGSGDVIGEHVGGALTMLGASGDVRVREVAGELTVKTASGDVSVGPVGGDVAITSISGDVTVGSVREGTVNIRSVSGDVEVGVARGTRVFLDLAASSGDTRSDLSRSDGVGDAPRMLELHVATVSGDIRVKREGR